MMEVAADSPMELLLSDSSHANLERAATSPSSGAPSCPVQSPFSCVAVRRGNPVVFESSEGAKRRLAPYPPDWRTVSTFELERWCMKAAHVPPAPARRAED